MTKHQGFKDCFGIEVSCAGTWGAVKRVADKAEPTYHALIEDLVASPVVSPDETGWKVAGHLWWL